MQKNSITNKITPCCNLPFSVIYWWVSNLTLSSEANREFIISKLSQSGTLSIDAWKVLINSGTLETDSTLTKVEFLAWFDCKRQPSCEQLKVLIESFKVGNWTPEAELPPNIALIDAIINGVDHEGNVYTKEQVDEMLTASFGGELKIADNPQPTTPKWWFASETGTYIHAGNIVTEANKINIILFDGTNWKKIIIPINVVFKTLFNVADNTTGSTDNAVFNYLKTITFDGKNLVLQGNSQQVYVNSQFQDFLVYSGASIGSDGNGSYANIPPTAGGIAVVYSESLIYPSKLLKIVVVV